MSTSKVKFNLHDDPLGIEAEWLWAKNLGGNLVEVDNSPFHLYGVSYKDVVETTSMDGSLQFASIRRKGGHRTIRVRFSPAETHSDFLDIWNYPSTLGCTFEGSQIERPLYAIDVPPGIDIELVVEYFSRLEENGVLEYEEADVY